MPSPKFETCDIAANMTKQIVDHPRYETQLGGVSTERIAFIHAVGKKKPSSIPSPAQIKALSPLVRAIVGNQVFVMVIYDEWYDWNEGKQYAALLEQLLLIKNDGDVVFEDGKLNKYDVLALSYMVMNFGLDWTTQPSIRHPIDDSGPATPPPASRGTPTFSGGRGRANARTDNAVTEVVAPDDFGDLDEALNDIPDEIETV